MTTEHREQMKASGPQTMQKVQIGNLAASSSEASVRALFAKHGAVGSYERPVDSAKRPRVRSRT